MPKPKVLLLDIESAPILGYVWGLWDNNLGLNQIHTDWHLLSWAAKWLGDPASAIMYEDQSDAKDIANDKDILKHLWDLLDLADVIITQNGKAFDQKKINARFILNGFKPPSSYKHIDTVVLARKHFGFTSNKLEYMTDKLCVKYKKLKHEKFSGFELWTECLKGNKAAWAEMEKYNKMDVLALEELYLKLAPWGTTVNFNLYSDETAHSCNCGSAVLKKWGFTYTAIGKFQRYKCTECGAESRDRKNLFDPAKRFNLKAVGVK